MLSIGCGYFGQLGHGDDASLSNPRLISVLDPSRKYLGELIGCSSLASAAIVCYVVSYYLVICCTIQGKKQLSRILYVDPTLLLS